MQRVAELINVVASEKEAFLQKSLNPDEEVRKFMWLHGMRNQYYFEMGDKILMTFEYEGNDFYNDMKALAAYPATAELLIRTRSRDVPENERDTTNWWAPLKRLGSTGNDNPFASPEEEDIEEENFSAMLSGAMIQSDDSSTDLSYSEDDWSESMHF